MGEAEKEEAARAEEVIASKQADFVAPPAKEEWGGEELSGAAPVTDWSADGAPAPAAAPAAPAAPAFQVTDDWAAQTETSDWAAQSAPAGEGAAPNANMGWFRPVVICLSYRT